MNSIIAVLTKSPVWFTKDPGSGVQRTLLIPDFDLEIKQYDGTRKIQKSQFICDTGKPTIVEIPEQLKHKFKQLNNERKAYEEARNHWEWYQKEFSQTPEVAIWLDKLLLPNCKGVSAEDILELKVLISSSLKIQTCESFPINTVKQQIKFYFAEPYPKYEDITNIFYSSEHTLDDKFTFDSVHYGPNRTIAIAIFESIVDYQTQANIEKKEFAIEQKDYMVYNNITIPKPDENDDKKDAYIKVMQNFLDRRLKNS